MAQRTLSTPKTAIPVKTVRDLITDPWPGYEGGVDFAYEATGLMQCVEQCVRMLNYGGTAVNIGFPGPTDEVTLNVGNIDTGVYWNKTGLAVCHAGDTLPSHDFPLLAQLYLQGPAETGRDDNEREIGLGDVEAAFHEMETGNVIRSVIKMPQ